MGLGEVFALASALAWAIGVILYRRLGETLPPMTLNFLKNLLVLGFVLPTVPLLHGTALPRLSLGELLTCLLSGMLGIALADTLYFRAINRLGASRAGVIGNFYSPFVIVLSYAFLGERLSGLQIAGFALVSLGVFLVGRPQGGARDGEVDLGAVLTGILAIFLMAAAIVMVKRILEAQPLLWIVLLRLLGGIAGMLLLFAWDGAPRLGASGAALRLLLPAAFVGQFLSMIFWLGGYKFTQASVAAILNESASVFIVLLAWLLLGERLPAIALLGVLLSLAGIGCMLLA